MWCEKYWKGNLKKKFRSSHPCYNESPITILQLQEQKPLSTWNHYTVRRCRKEKATTVENCTSGSRQTSEGWYWDDSETRNIRPNTTHKFHLPTFPATTCVIKKVFKGFQENRSIYTSSNSGLATHFLFYCLIVKWFFQNCISIW